jgi:uncharacterized protein YjbI with pentapeptide repeats
MRKRSTWRVQWRARGQPWRTEPEIGVVRQQELVTCRRTKPNIQQGVYPFSGLTLSRADIEWLLATHESCGVVGPVDWSAEGQRGREGLDLRGADLRGLNLRGLPLARTIGSFQGATDEQRERATIHMERADLRSAHLEGALLLEVHLDEAQLDEAHFEGANLSRAVLTRARCRNAHFAGTMLRNAEMQKADLYSAHFEGAAMSGARLQGATLSNAHMEGVELGGARLEGAFLQYVHLEGAKLFGAHLENASLPEAHLEGAVLPRAHLEGAILRNARFEGVLLPGETVQRVRPWQPDFPERLPPADLRLVFFDAGTVLTGATLGDERNGYVAVADARWGDVNLSVVRWSRGPRGRAVMLGDEREARRHRNAAGERATNGEHLAAYEAAVRANRQLALALRAQGLSEDADRFAYQAQVLQRVVARRQGRLGTWLFSHILDGLAGYGYKPGRSLVAYLVLILLFATGYYLLGQQIGPRLSPDGALVFSITSFHGRGFFPGGVDIESPVTKLAAAEALVGLVIEISFIATFTQRFFGK